MSSYEDEKCDQPSDNMELKEYKVDVGEAFINLGCVKKEFDEGEFEFDENRYKLALTYENIFGESSKEQRDNKDSLIGFLDNEVIMETGCIKLEDIKQEEELIREIIEQPDCNKCGGKYEGYCRNCSSVSHFLNNVTPNIKPEPILNTVPISTLQIREISNRQAVFALKTLPKGIILGPFEGVTAIESTTGPQWKIKDSKLVNDQNGNWMKYIQSVANHASKNLDVYQIDGILYFETSREIQEGEQLLVCYREEKDEVLKSDNEEEFYLIPLKKEEYPKVFACTLCCLGFRLEGCLVEHKSKCSHGGSSEDFQIVQCRCCKVWLEKREHLENHMLHCLENYNRLCRNRYLPDVPPTITAVDEQVDENDEITPSIGDVNASYSTLPTEPIDSNTCFLRTEVDKEEYFHDKKNVGTTHSNTINLKSHLGTHTKHFQCDICKQRFGRKDTLRMHIKYKHSNTNEKEYKCSECSYQTNYKVNLKSHLSTHTDIKHFQCDICKQSFGHKNSLQMHIKNQHSNTNEKEYKCSDCSYQTNHKGNLKYHLGTHTKHFQCDICKQIFGYKSNLIMHIKDKHSNPNEKEYKCSECSYQTNHKGNLKTHLGTHTKHFQCDICKQRFGSKDTLRMHIKYKHSNTNEKEYKCSECSYQTNYKVNLKSHLSTHTDIKHFQCDICKQSFGHKNSLQMHIKNQHSNTNEKEYKCSDCSYQTNHKGNLKSHLGTHTDVKAFECDICKQRFSHKGNLKRHIKDKHSNTNEKEYKCSECSYQTNHKGHLKIHLVTHTDVKDFQCDICKRRFTRNGYLQKHIKNQH